MSSGTLGRKAAIVDIAPVDENGVNYGVKHTNNTPHSIITGTNYVSGQSGIDSSTNDIVTIEHEHNEIHEGDHYYIQGYIEINNGDTYYVKMTTPNTTTWLHFIFDINSTGICSTTLDEDATGGMTGGSVITPINNDRNSSNTSANIIVSGVTSCTGYTTRVENDKWGSSGFKETIGGGSSRSDELILKQNTVYCRGFISGADNNIIQFKASWYEHQNKN